MDMGSVMDELAAALGAVSGLFIYAFNPGSIQAPAVVVGFPERIEFDVSMARGCDRLMFPVTVVVARSTDGSMVRERLTRYVSGQPDSQGVKWALENGTYQACDSVRVTEAVFDVIDIAGIDYVAAQFTVEVIGGQ